VSIKNILLLISRKSDVPVCLSFPWIFLVFTSSSIVLNRVCASGRLVGMCVHINVIVTT